MLQKHQVLKKLKNLTDYKKLLQYFQLLSVLTVNITG
jgi:hypothetical protein